MAAKDDDAVCTLNVALIVEGLRGPVPKMGFCDLIQLRPCRESETEVLAKEDRFTIVDPSRFCTLEGRFRFHDALPELGDFQRLQRYVASAAEAIRLVISGTIGWRLTLFSSPEQNQFTVFPLASFAGAIALGEGPASASTSQLAEIEQFWRRTKPILASVEDRPRLRIALERFSDSYARRKRVDKLIDLAICLEALFGDHGQREKGRLIADKASCLVAGDELSAEALVARREIRDLYRARNAAVHGGICDVNSETLLRWKQLVRLCLRRYLQREANSQ